MHDIDIGIPSPRLGLFWFIGTLEDTKLVGLSKDAEDVTAIGGFKTLDEGHVDVWKNVVRAMPELSRYGYEFFPRGRVNWAADDDRYILLADRLILAREMHLKVVDDWHLPKDRLLVLADPHYRLPFTDDSASRGAATMEQMTYEGYISTFRQTIADARRALPAAVYELLTMPQLLVLTPEYERTTTRLMIYGRETYGVEIPLSSVEAEDDVRFNALESDIRAGFDKFDVARDNKFKNKPFWKGYQQACDTFGLESRRAAAWTNVSKSQTLVPNKKGYTIADLPAEDQASVLRWQRQLFLAEIAYARPDALLFFSGGLTWIVRNTLRSGDDWSLKSDVVEGRIGSLATGSGTLSAPLLGGIPAAYTYHPNALRKAEDRAMVKEHRTETIEWLVRQVDANGRMAGS